MASKNTGFHQSDAELIARLRSQIGDDVQHVYDHEALFRISADRIEQLLNLNEALVELMDDRDAKLAKAVEVLSFASNVDTADWSEALDVRNQARATLAAIKTVDLGVW